MNALRIKICPRSDLSPAFPEVKPEQELMFESVALLEGGCKSGKTSLFFVLKGADGKHHVAQMTQNIFEGLSGALKGANERFKISGN